MTFPKFEKSVIRRTQLHTKTHKQRPDKKCKEMMVVKSVFSLAHYRIHVVNNKHAIKKIFISENVV